MKREVLDAVAPPSELEYDCAMLRVLVEAMPHETGSRFLKSLVKQLAAALDVKYALIAECRPDNTVTAQTVAVWTGHRFEKGFSYRIHQTPCEAVLKGSPAFFSDKLRELFPHDPILHEWHAESYAGTPVRGDKGDIIGHLAVLHDQPLTERKRIGDILALFARRAAVEMQRRMEDRRRMTRLWRYRGESMELRSQKAKFEKLDRIVTVINSELCIRDLLQSVLEETRMIQGVDKTTAILLDKGTGTYRMAASTDPDIAREVQIELTPEEAEERYAKNSREIFEDVFIIDHVHGRAAEAKLIHLGLPASILAMRIRIQNDIAGYLIFNNMSNERAFDQQDVHLLALLKEHLLSALIKIRLLEALQDANEKKNEFLGMTAHDLRNPLLCLKGYVDMMLHDTLQNRLNPAALRSDLENMQLSIDRMSRMIRDLLDIAAIESGQIQLQYEAVNLRQILDECLERHERHARQKQITLTIDTTTRLPDLWMDRMRITEVMDNLLNNAIKFTSPSGRVEVTFSVGRDAVVMRVCDTGQGLSEEDLQQIFHGFRKLSARPTGGEPSTGLGLFIVKKIVEKHGGSVFVKSSKAVGSTFGFSLPIHPPALDDPAFAPSWINN